MKESLYGWYPPAKDIWSTYRAPGKSYEQECLYKHHDSRYNDRLGVSTPKVPTPLRMSPQHGRAAPRTFGGRRPPSHTPQTDGLLIESIRAELKQRPHSSQPPHSPDNQQPPGKQTPVKVFSPAPPPRSQTGHRPRPQKAWSMNLPETQVAGPPMPRPPSSHHPPPSAGSLRPSRIQSATQPRSRLSPPARPTKSAGPTRSAPVTDPELIQGPVVSVRPDPPPPSPGPLEEDDEFHPGVEDPLDYEEELEKHGWRMEVPGDPLRLKRPCIHKRLSYTCELPEPTIKPNPPQGKMENFETYFFNTIPRRRATFTVHKEWISEVLSAKRLELQKRDGTDYKYRHTNYSFAY